MAHLEPSHMATGAFCSIYECTHKSVTFLFDTFVLLFLLLFVAQSVVGCFV